MQEIAGELYLECGNLLIELAQTSFVGIIEVCSVALKSLVYFLHHFLLLMSEVSGIDVIIDLLHATEESRVHVYVIIMLGEGRRHFLGEVTQFLCGVTVFDRFEGVFRTFQFLTTIFQRSDGIGKSWCVRIVDYFLDAGILLFHSLEECFLVFIYSDFAERLNAVLVIALCNQRIVACRLLGDNLGISIFLHLASSHCHSSCNHCH